MKCNSVGLVLQLSRLIGIAPYVHGSKYRVSRVIDICGKVVLTCVCIVSPISAIFNTFFKHERLDLTLDITHVASRVLTAIIVLTGTFTAAGRITRISEILKQLEQIDLNVHLRRKTSVNRRLYFIGWTYVTTSFLLRLSLMIHVIVTDHSCKYYLLLPFITRSIIDVIALILCTEPFHQTHVQMDRTHLNINYLKCQRRENEEVSNELETFLRLLLLNKTTYSPLRLCTLARPLVVKIFGSLVTYLVIILTYGPEMSQPTLAINNKKSFA
ncbi:uncharacterized protein LOC124534204 [Vanessa cardui]|uniref:uncharacterized protein LOC124534204 n=1 Tax=Vanessa cardui TaxID=171605 RepID=UPI001F12A099|nr:uncharacterized protein LOC124534204 [Vanessa cardui]